MRNLVNEMTVKGTIWMEGLKDRARAAMAARRKGEVAFEYIIILVLMVAFIVAAFLILRPVILQKAQEVADFVGGINVERGTVPGTK